MNMTSTNNMNFLRPLRYSAKNNKIITRIFKSGENSIKGVKSEAWLNWKTGAQSDNRREATRCRFVAGHLLVDRVLGGRISIPWVYTYFIYYKKQLNKDTFWFCVWTYLSKTKTGPLDTAEGWPIYSMYKKNYNVLFNLHCRPTS